MACKPTSVVAPRGPTSGISPLSLVAGIGRSPVGEAGRLTDWPVLLPPIGEEIAHPDTLLAQRDSWRASLIEVSVAVEHHRPTVVPLRGITSAPAREPPLRAPACPAAPAAPASVTSSSSGMGGGRDGSILALSLAAIDGLTLAGGVALGLATLAPRQRAERIVVPPD